MSIEYIGEILAQENERNEEVKKQEEKRRNETRKREEEKLKSYKRIESMSNDDKYGITWTPEGPRYDL